MLRVSLLGNLGADPELRYSQKGAPLCSFRVASNQVRTTAEGERQETTEWFRVKAMGRLAESAQRLARGGRVLVVGRLEISHYQSREGEPRVGYDIWADEVINLSSRPAGDPEAAEMGALEAMEAGAGAGAEASSPPAAQPRPQPVAAGAAAPPTRRSAAPPDDFEDLPF